MKRPNTGNYLVWDIDAGVIVAWLVLGGEIVRLYAGRVSGSLKKPKQEPAFAYERREASFVLSPAFVRELAGMGVRHVLVETAHVKPRKVSIAQSFSHESINAWLQTCADNGIEVLSLRYNSARYALKWAGVQKRSQNDTRKWWQDVTDACVLAKWLLDQDDFGNFGLLRPQTPEQQASRLARREREMTLREPVQELLNTWKHQVEDSPAWIPWSDLVPQQVTQALAAVLTTYPDWSWSKAKRVFHLHGRSASGRGLAMLVRSEVCHQQGGRAFVDERGWAAVKHEFRRVRAAQRGEQHHEPHPTRASNSGGIARIIPIRQHQQSLPIDGMYTPANAGALAPTAGAIER